MNFENPNEISKERKWDSLIVLLLNSNITFRGTDAFETFDNQCSVCKKSLGAPIPP